MKLKISQIVIYCIIVFRAIAILLNARDIGSKILQDISHTWEWILA
jgi:hypothetical protein